MKLHITNCNYEDNWKNVQLIIAINDFNGIIAINWDATLVDV